MASRSWINLGADGTFALGGKSSSTAADVDCLLGDALSSTSRLVLFFHGGLVSEASGLASAERMAGNYGTTAASIGITWETGLAETFRDNLLSITDTKIFKKSLSWVLAKAGFGDDNGAKGSGGGPLDAAEIEAMLETPEGAAALDRALPAQAEAAASTASAKAAAWTISTLKPSPASLNMIFRQIPRYRTSSTKGHRGPSRSDESSTSRRVPKV
jgi:hypothetical protein